MNFCSVFKKVFKKLDSHFIVFRKEPYANTKLLLVYFLKIQHQYVVTYRYVPIIVWLTYFKLM